MTGTILTVKIMSKNSNDDNEDDEEDNYDNDDNDDEDSDGDHSNDFDFEDTGYIPLKISEIKHVSSKANQTAVHVQEKHTQTM